MGSLSRFEDLKVWQDSRNLNSLLFELFLTKDDKKFGFLINHIFKTSGSIMDNIAEGFEREGNKELIQFLYYSKGSAGELRSQLYRSLDLQLIDSNSFDKLLVQIVSISNQLSQFIKYLKNSEIKGNKFKEPQTEYSNFQSITSFINTQD